MTDTIAIYPNDEWSLGINVAVDICVNFAPGSIILEFGSGESSRFFAEMGYIVYSVEEDENYIDKYPGVNYIYAPIDPKTEWYDVNAIREHLPDHIDVLIIDGPCKGNRSYFGAEWKNILSHGGEARLPLFMYIDDFQMERDGRSLFFDLLKSNPVWIQAYEISIMSTGQLLQPVGDKHGYDGLAVKFSLQTDRIDGKALLPSMLDVEKCKRFFRTKKFEVLRKALAEEAGWKISVRKLAPGGE